MRIQTRFFSGRSSYEDLPMSVRIAFVAPRLMLSAQLFILIHNQIWCDLVVAWHVGRTPVPMLALGLAATGCPFKMEPPCTSARDVMGRRSFGVAATACWSWSLLVFDHPHGPETALPACHVRGCEGARVRGFSSCSGE